ncbi:MAG: peroxiredoxin-like family protein [Terriglobales bacterium]
MRWRGLDEAAPEQHTTLKEALDERRALMEQYVPADTQTLHRSVVEQIRDTASAALTVGTAAPEFELPDHNGKIVALHRLGAAGATPSLVENGPAVLLFFRGRWCPFCVAQLEAWNRLVPAISRAGIALVAISPMTQHQSSLTHDQHRLLFPLLSDAGNQVARKFGIVYSVPEEQRRVYRRTFVNLPFVNGDESWELPIPATFVVGREGRVLYSSADADYTQRPEPLEVLARLEG